MPDGSAFGLLPGCALCNLPAADWEEALARLAGAAVAAGHGRPTLVEAVIERERRFPTGLPTEVASAIPHTDAVHVVRAGLGVATLAEPVAFGQMGGAGETLPVRFVVMLFITDPADQVAALQQVLGRLSDTAGVQQLLDVTDQAGFEAAVEDWLRG